jgi:hypothetical protein
MPKPVYNNKITYNSIAGIIIKHDGYLNQAIKVESSPTFANLQITGNATVDGNLWVKGNTTILDTKIVEFEDNILLINSRETGNGITLNQSGFEIERGNWENYRMVYNESDQTYKIGVISNLQAVATRQDNPLSSGVMTWNNASRRLDAVDTIAIDLTLSGTTESTSNTTGVLTLGGGMGIRKSLHVGGKLALVGGGATQSEIWTNVSTNSLNITSTTDINLTPILNVKLPFDKAIALGTTEQSISSDAFTKDINVLGSGHVNFYLENGKRINIPNQVALTFSTQNEKIYTDSGNNMVVTGRQDIFLNPGANRKVVLPVDIPISFGNEFQAMSANLSNDLTIKAGNHIYLAPGDNLDVRIPTDNGLKFGGSGSQRVYSDSNNNLYIGASVDIYLSAQRINIPVDVPVTFGGNSQSIRASSTGTIMVSNTGSTLITSTRDADSGSSGSMVVAGGLAVGKTILTNGAVVIDTTSGNALVVKQRDEAYNVLAVDPNSSGRVQVIAGDGSHDHASLEVVNATNASNATSLIQLRALHDSAAGYTIGRGTSSVNGGRTMNVNVPNYSDYSNTGSRPKFAVTSDNGTTELMSVESETGNVSMRGVFISNTQDAVNATTGALQVSGGLGVAKAIYTNGKFTVATDSTQGVLITDSSHASIVTVDTIAKSATVTADFSIDNKFYADISSNVITNSMVTRFTNTTDSVDMSNASLVVSGGVSVQNTMRISGQTDLYSRLHMHDQPITNVKNPVNLQDVATKAYVDLAALRGLYAKESVQIATTTHGNLSTDYNPGAVIDGYTLKEYDRILIKNQINATENGLYVVYSTGAPQRSIDLINGDHAVGIFTFIQFGDLQASTGWICNSSENNDVVGTDNIDFVQFSGLGEVTTGDGLSKNFNEIFVNVDNNSIEIVEDTLRIKSSIVGTGLTGGSGAPIETLADQSHVTKLGTINTGIWQGSTVDVGYGGTGSDYFSAGSVLYGNGTSGLKSSNGFTFDNDLKQLSVSNSINISGISGNPQLVLSENNVDRGVLGVTTDFGEYGTDTYTKSFVIKNIDNSTSSNVQIVTRDQTRMTVLHNGNVGINTSDPGSTLSVNGTLSVSDVVTINCTNNATNLSTGSFRVQGGTSIAKDMQVGGKVVVYDTTPATTTNNGAVVLHGGLSITGNQNAVNVGNGGALTVAGGGSIGGDLYIGGQINGSGSSSSNFAYLTITATDEAINLTTGSIITFGGVTIQSITNASGLEDGGALLVAGGASVGQDFYVGGNQSNYGQAEYYGDETTITFKSSDGVARYSIDRTDAGFSLSRYDADGDFIANVFQTDATTGQTTLGDTSASLSVSSASLVVMGGISVNSAQDATSITNGGGVTNIGGQSVGKRLFVGGDTRILSTSESQGVTSGALVVGGGVGVGGTLNIKNSFTIEKGNVLLDIIDNSESSNASWYYMGDVTSSYSELEFSNGVNESTSNYSLKVISNVSASSAHVSHSHTGNVDSFDVGKVDCYVFRNTAATAYHLFAHVPPHSTTNVVVKGKTNKPFKLINEGSSTSPNGVTSGYTGTWTQIYTTVAESNLGLAVGSFVSHGDRFKIADNIPIVGYNTASTAATRNIGVLYQRYQRSNNVGEGDIVSGTYAFEDVLPNQSTATSLQIKFSNFASSLDNYYNGWWIRIVSGSNTDQVRKIVNYNGGQRVAEVDVAWEDQNPASGDNVYFFNSSYVTNYFDEQSKTFRMAYADVDPESNIMVPGELCDFRAGHAYITDTTPSLNATSGSMIIVGGVSVNTTNDATSCTSGGGLTASGGMAVGKRLFVGDNVVIGTGGIVPQSSLHIKQTNACLTLESNQSSYSFIDFVESGTSNRFGLLSDMSAGSFSLTYNTAGNSPESAIRVITVQSTGNLGINTSTNINNMLVLASNNYISTNTDTGYLGIMGGNTSGSNVMLYGNNHSTNPGDLKLQTGSSGSSFRVHTNTSGNPVLAIAGNGVMTLDCTQFSTSVSTGSMIARGGIAIATTKNASSTDNGGGLTIAGGAAIKKDTFIGGDLYLAGSLIATGEPLSPTITFTNTIGCSITSHSNNQVVAFAAEAMFSMCIEVTPIAGSEYCQFEFDLPGRDSSFTARGDLIGTCSGYTDDSDLTPIFNTLCVGATGSVNALVKFQSVNTGIHYITVICRYTIG